MLDAVHPLTIIDFSILPLVDTFTVRLALFVRSVVRVAVCEEFVAAAMTLILDPFSFIDSSVMVDKDSKTFALSFVIQLSSIDAIFVLLNAEFRISSDFFIVKLIGDHLVALNRVTLVFELSVLFARRSKSLLEHLLFDIIRDF